MRILTVIGTRPEAIKMAPVVSELRRRPSEVTALTCVTAQHREMLDQVLDLFGIRADFDLDLMEENQTVFDTMSRALGKLKPVFDEAQPDVVLVQGDTTTTFIASLVAFLCRTTVGHIEAGLRTYNKHAPFPEEMNRRLTGVLADRHFPPTESARQNLLRENVNEEDILVTGNTVIDALLTIADKECELTAPPFNELDPDKRILLVTAHRRESFGEPFENICHALADIAERNEDVQIVYPVHPNPNVQEPVKRIIGTTPRIRLIQPLDYFHFVQMMKLSYLILTDSGGIQEEAPSLGKPVLVMRDVTERPEGIDAGTVKLVGTSREKIVRETQMLLDDPQEYQRMAQATNPYGDGKASGRIVDFLLRKGHRS